MNRYINFAILSVLVALPFIIQPIFDDLNQKRALITVACIQSLIGTIYATFGKNAFNKKKQKSIFTPLRFVVLNEKVLGSALISIGVILGTFVSIF